MGIKAVQYPDFSRGIQEYPKVFGSVFILKGFEKCFEVLNFLIVLWLILVLAHGQKSWLQKWIWPISVVSYVFWCSKHGKNS